MKTTDLNHICPYTGLRSFTEEESLYFKGRDLQVDQITALLEQNKFLMVTGASGEGKSSLIYAGLIPNARAGFFKARYSNWLVADFRPERNPVANMAKAIADQLNLQADTVEIELRRGYSSLIDLYLSSVFYAGEDEPGWDDLSDADKKDRKRKAANLMILVDQFEEFFTNPENFFNDVHSTDAQIVVNLILETSRIAIKRNLPVYMVCTMRSDYIGQCSSFRGLPEYIGFSQFFVPRLKRKDLKQVIEEPAILSGNRISQRLIERLVYDIAEGVDQLPILQHALSRIWKAANNGAEEMDLLQYAMVGGMHADDLPDEDRIRFSNWLAQLPEQQQRFYSETGLNRIIEIHANQLYEGAYEYYNQANPGQPISQKEAKRIVALTFSCLTKIDNSRAVRNRMTLAEITAIINNPEITTEVAGKVINVFREEGNSFIRPFKTEDPATFNLSPNTVLDITHESLIRNWDKLNTWANREFEFYSTFLDFKKQLDRWKASGKSRDYLLPIGPLTYFENWYKNCKPNTGWISRYAGVQENQHDTQLHAEATLQDTKDFLKRSASKEMITRAFMKYGPARIATIAAILVMGILSGFYWYDAEQKKNENVIEKLRSQSAVLMESEEVNVDEKANYLIANERFDSGSMVKALVKKDFKTRIKLGVEAYKILEFVNHQEDSEFKKQLRALLMQDFTKPEVTDDPELLLTYGNKFMVLLAMDQYYTPDAEKEAARKKLADVNFNLALRFYRDQALFRPVLPTELNLAVQFWLTLGDVTPEKTRALLQAISPLEGAEAAFNRYYAKGGFETNGRLANDFYGGYHTLACLYASLGELDKVFACFNQLLENNQRNYFEQSRVLNNHINVLGFLYQYKHRDQVPAFLAWLNKNTRDNPPITILRNAVIRSGYISHLYMLNVDQGLYRSARGYFHPNLYFSERSQFDALLEDYENAINQVKDPSERNFLLAMNGKRKAIFYAKYWYDRRMPMDTPRLDRWLDEAMAAYNKISADSLESKQSVTLIYNFDGVRTSEVSRKNLFIYPDYRDGWFSWTYHGNYFFNYLRRKGLMTTLYKTGEDLQALHLWLAKAFEWRDAQNDRSYSNNYLLPDSTIEQVVQYVDQSPSGASFDRNLPLLVLANRAFERKDTTLGLKRYNQLNLANIRSSEDRYEYLEKIFIMNMLKQLSEHLALAGKKEDAFRMVKLFDQDYEQMLAYISIAEKLFRQSANPLAFDLIDSANQISKRVDYSKVPFPIDSRYLQIMLLSEIGSKPLNNAANNILRELPNGPKVRGVISRALGIAYEGNYYRALSSLPSTLTEQEDLLARSFILMEASKTNERKTGDTKWAALDENYFWFMNYINYIPN